MGRPAAHQMWASSLGASGSGPRRRPKVGSHDALISTLAATSRDDQQTRNSGDERRDEPAGWRTKRDGGVKGRPRLAAFLALADRVPEIVPGATAPARIAGVKPNKKG